MVSPPFPNERNLFPHWEKGYRLSPVWICFYLLRTGKRVNSPTTGTMVWSLPGVNHWYLITSGHQPEVLSTLSTGGGTRCFVVSSYIWWQGEDLAILCAPGLPFRHAAAPINHSIHQNLWDPQALPRQCKAPLVSFLVQRGFEAFYFAGALSRWARVWTTGAEGPSQLSQAIGLLSHDPRSQSYISGWLV